MKYLPQVGNGRQLETCKMLQKMKVYIADYLIIEEEMLWVLYYEREVCDFEYMKGMNCFPWDW